MNATLWDTIPALLEQGVPVAAATIAARDGSAPRSAGAKMLVRPDGVLIGTLGGGLPEAMAAEEAKKTLADGQPRTLAVDMSGSAKDGADLICGGRVSIFIQRLDPARLSVFQTLRDRLRHGDSSILLSPLRDSSPPLVVLPDDTGDLALAVANAHPDAAQLFEHAGVAYLLEPLRARTRLVLAGGGHVSLATSRIAVDVGFDVTILDDRQEFADAARFPWLEPNHTHVTKEFKDCLTETTLGYPVNQHCFIAILTRGHSFDGEVLAQALQTPAGYIGMIGSRRKRDALYAQLRTQGFSQAALDRVHSPIGLSIGAETPEEIAVSITAELIAARARKQPDKGSGNKKNPSAS